MAGKNQRKYSFQEVVEKKVDNVSKSIEVLTKLSNRKNYDYDQNHHLILLLFTDYFL